MVEPRSLDFPRLVGVSAQSPEPQRRRLGSRPLIWEPRPVDSGAPNPERLSADSGTIRDPEPVGAGADRHFGIREPRTRSPRAIRDPGPAPVDSGAGRKGPSPPESGVSPV